MRGLTAAVACAAFALAGCGSSGNPRSGLTVRVDTDPFRITVVENGKTVVSEDKHARLRYQLASSGVQHFLTKVISSHGNVYSVATDEPGRTATVAVVRARGAVRISLRLHPATNVQQVYDSFDTASTDHFLGGGERGDTVDLRGQIIPVKVSNACSYAPVPFFSSSAGWGLRVVSSNVGALAFPGSPGGGGCQFGDEPRCTFPSLPERVEACVRGARLDEEVYVGDFAHVLSAYEAHAGRPVVPPRSELALIKWRGRSVFARPADVLDDIHRFRASGIPIGWVLLDDVWQSCMGTLQFDTSRFPDPAGLIRSVHALGVRFMLWVSPKVVCWQGYRRAELLGTPDDATLDLTRPAVVHEFQRRLRLLVALGIDGVKGDRGDEVDLGQGNGQLQNEYPLLYARDVMSVLRPGSGAIFRAASMGSQSVLPGLWAGDQPEDWTGFQRAIRAGETAAMSGFPTWGSDVGGYDSSDLTGDLFARWAQLGAVSPIFEVGGSGANSKPWTLGPDAIGALRDAAVLHYELFPYLYGLLSRGEPVLRPLAYGFPSDAASWQAEFELLVGPDLLAAPVTGPGTTPSVYLPPGLWVDLSTGATVKGPITFTRATPIGVLPLYARAGAVVPFDLRTADSWWSVDELTHPGRAGYLVTDGTGLDLRAQPRDVQLWVPASTKPTRVTFGGHPVAWAWNAVPFPGVVIRVHGPTVRGQIVLSGA